MMHGSEYITMPSRDSAALSPIGLCRVMLRVRSRTGTVTRSLSPNHHILIMKIRRRTIKDQTDNNFVNRTSPPSSLANYCYMRIEYTTHEEHIYSQKQINKNPLFESSF